MATDYSHIMAIFGVKIAYSYILRNSYDTISLMHAFMSTKILRYFSHVHPAMFSALLSSHHVDGILGSKPRLSICRI